MLEKDGEGFSMDILVYSSEGLLRVGKHEFICGKGQGIELQGE